MAPNPLAVGIGAPVIIVGFLASVVLVCLRKNVHVVARHPALLGASLGSGLLTVVVILISYIINGIRGGGVSCHAVLWPTVMFLPVFSLPYFLRAYVLYFNFTWRSQAATKAGIIPGRWFRLFKARSSLILFGVYFAVVSLTLVIIGIGSAVYLRDLPDYTISVDRDCIPLYHRVVTTVEAVVFILLLGVATWQLWHVTDVFGFKIELILATSLTVPLAVIWILSRMIGFLSEIPGPLWPLLIYLICNLVSLGVPIYQIVRYRSSLQRGDSSSFVEMEPQHGVSNSAEFLQMIIHNEELCESLRKFMVTNWSVENLLFLLDVINFKDVTRSPEERQAEAERIYELYLSPTADFELNIDFADKEAIMEAIQANSVKPDTFEVARSKTFNVIRHDSIPRWRMTEEYKLLWESHRRKSSSKSDQPLVFKTKE